MKARRPNKVYFDPGTAVWATRDGKRRAGVVDARQGGVYRVRFSTLRDSGLFDSSCVSRRIP